MRAGGYVVIPPGKSKRSQSPPPLSLLTKFASQNTLNHYFPNFALDVGRKQNPNVARRLMQINQSNVSQIKQTKVMATKKEKESANNVANVSKDVTIKGANIKAVRVYDDGAGSAKRVIFDLDCEPFESIKQETGEMFDTTSFSKDTIEVINQIGDKVPILQLASTLALGKRINPQIIALSLINAKIDIVREFKEKGEARNEGRDDAIFDTDTYVTRIVNVVPASNPLNEQFIMSLIQTNLLAEAPKARITNVAPNPFQIG